MGHVCFIVVTRSDDSRAVTFAAQMGPRAARSFLRARSRLALPAAAPETARGQLAGGFP